MNYLKWEIKAFLSGFRLYRSFKGGKWYRVRPKYEYGIYGTYWINRKPLFNELVITKEVY